MVTHVPDRVRPTFNALLVQTHQLLIDEFFGGDPGAPPTPGHCSVADSSFAADTVVIGKSNVFQLVLHTFESG
jgi:hypothetical protein